MFAKYHKSIIIVITIIILTIFVSILMILTSCSGLNTYNHSNDVDNDIDYISGSDSDNDSNNPYYHVWGDKSNWCAVKGAMPDSYIRLDDINKYSVPEIKLQFDIGMYGNVIRETTDGYLYGNMLSLDEKSSDSWDAEKVPKIRKLDKNGKVIWEKIYDYKTYSGQLNNLLVYHDDSFLFSVNTYPRTKDNQMVYEKSYIIKCDKSGTELWKSDFDDYSGSLFQNIFITSSNEIIIVGQCYSKAGRQTKGDASQANELNGDASQTNELNGDASDDIVVIKLDKSGNILNQKSFGGSDFDNLYNARYDEEIGIIINGRTQSKDGDFAANTKEVEYNNVEFVACIDNDLNLKWVVHENDKKKFITMPPAISEGFIYVVGGHVSGIAAGSGSNAAPDGFLMKLDKNGKKIFEKTHLFNNYWGQTLSVLNNGDIVIGTGKQNQGIIIIIDKYGNVKKELEDIKFSPGNIVPTEDGGFITTAHRIIKTVPQPPVISSIWYDTELVVVKYGSNYSIEWRKTYNKYKDEMGFDFVIPFKTGKVIIE